MTITATTIVRVYYSHRQRALDVIRLRILPCDLLSIVIVVMMIASIIIVIG